MTMLDATQTLSLHEDLQRINQQINFFLQQDPILGWKKLETLVSTLYSFVDIPSLIATTPVKIPYTRQPFYSENAAACLTAFIFKRHDHPGAAVLLHVYGSLSPNGEFFSEETVLNKPQSENGIVHSTPIHNHTVPCHSYVAWVSQDVTVRERLYQRSTDGLILQDEYERAVGSSVLDETRGDYFHSIGVWFKN